MNSECCNGTGLADYAAVPCPNPKCPVIKEMSDKALAASRGEKTDDPES